MKRRIVLFGYVIMTTLLFIGLIYSIVNNEQSIPERVNDAVMIINGGSGVIIYNDEQDAFVLTAHHVIADNIKNMPCSGCEYDTNVYNIYYIDIEDQVKVIEIEYNVVNIIYDEKLDIALLHISPSYSHLNPVKVSTKTPHVGDDIWVAANPLGEYRSLKKGIIGSVERYVGDAIKSFDFSGGIAPGSSGGGIFNSNGEVIGVIKQVASFTTSPFCTIPITFLGISTTTDQINNFLRDSVYKKYFYGEFKWLR